ncbi:MAG: Na/Pi cotransporter family protein [Coprobacillus sp.]|nr:Na/Pi cotransporter family protein [Coprobacillus sp.]
MKIQDMLGMIGGLSLFLFGMNMMSGGLEKIAGNHLEMILKKLTYNKWKAVFTGIVVTALIHSSSAMTVMLIGFVNSGLMPLENAIWVVMGANIGTTITGQMLALDVGTLSPLLAFIGVIMFVFFKKEKMNYTGETIGGFGILFMGLEIMSVSLMPLKDSSFFLSLLQWLSYPILGMFVGIIFTAIIQSSSASIGILQSLAKMNLISLEKATYIIFGFDIGTCITAFLASLSGSRSGKQLALFHLLLNIFGAILFTLICLCTPFIEWVSMLTPHLMMTQIANMHTIFNVGTTVIALFFDQYLIQFIYKILPS